MTENEKIEYFKILLSNISDIGSFNISTCLPEANVWGTINLEKEQRNKQERLNNALKNFGIAHKYFEKGESISYKLTEKGIKAKELGGHLEYKKHSENKPLTLFQKLQLTITIFSLIIAVTFGVLNYLLSREKVDLINENNLLKNDIVHYKDSLNSNKEKTLLKLRENLIDTIQTKSYPDLNN
jgi:hypothetical protein